LNNIFECFDWLNEKEFLIDINNWVFYESGFFKTKKSPLYDFSDINKIQKKFETKNGIKILENFINKYSNSNFELTYQKSKYYHKIHSIFLYFIYIVFLMYQNIKKTNITLKELKDIDCDWIFEWHISLIQKRLHYIEQIHNDTFQKYRNRLELFFKLF